MRERREGCVFVVSDGGLEGVVTERDVTLRIVARGVDPTQKKVSRFMTVGPFAVHKDDALAFALHRMGVDGYRHIPVLDGKELLGFLSSRTVLQILAAHATD